MSRISAKRLAKRKAKNEAIYSERQVGGREKTAQRYGLSLTRKN